MTAPGFALCRTCVYTVWVLALFLSMCGMARGAPAQPDGPPAANRAQLEAGTKVDSSGVADKIFLRSITALVFSENARVRSRHGGGHAQLACVGGSAAGFFWSTDVYPRIVQCANIGWDGASVQWSCNAALTKDLVFGDTIVICEGYDFPGDQYVLRGSCRLEYTLNYASFRVSSLHVIYGSVLTVAMLWAYYYSRLWARAGINKLTPPCDPAQPMFATSTTYQSIDSPRQVSHAVSTSVALT
jgi:SOCE-associated regulatory factor of calcium homoeostasis